MGTRVITAKVKVGKAGLRAEFARPLPAVLVSRQRRRAIAARPSCTANKPVRHVMNERPGRGASGRPRTSCSSATRIETEQVVEQILDADPDLGAHAQLREEVADLLGDDVEFLFKS